MTTNETINRWASKRGEEVLSGELAEIFAGASLKTQIAFLFAMACKANDNQMQEAARAAMAAAR